MVSATGHGFLDECQAPHCPPSANGMCDWPRCAPDPEMYCPLCQSRHEPGAPCAGGAVSRG